MFAVAHLFALVAMTTVASAKKCCMADQSEMSYWDTPDIGWGRSNVVYTDHIAGKQAVVAVARLTPDMPARLLYRNVIFKEEGKLYSILSDNSCYEFRIDASFLDEQCLPEDYKDQAASYVGRSPENHRFVVYQFSMATMNITQVIGMDCVPIVQYLKGTMLKQPIEESQFMYGYKEGISDMSVFDLPDTCFIK